MLYTTYGRSREEDKVAGQILHAPVYLRAPNADI